MSLRFGHTWSKIELHRLGPEMRATWSEFEMYANDRCLTQVVERKTRERRSHLHLPLYDLAEWFAFHWFFITTPYSYAQDYGAAASARYDLRKVGGGFPLPGVVFRPEDDILRLSISPRGGPHARVGLTAAGEESIPLAQAAIAISDFVGEVLARLQLKGVRETLLEQEWTRVRSLDSEQQEFCRASALLGLDPFSLRDHEVELILSLSDAGISRDLLFSILPSVPVVQAMDGVEWVRSQLPRLAGAAPLPDDLRTVRDVLTLQDSDGDARVRPWHVGWSRASKVRALLGLEPDQFLDVQDLVRLEEADTKAPGRIDALVEASPDATLCVVSSHRPRHARRFAAARTLGRALYDAKEDAQVVWHGPDQVFRAERAFAAELLAPARGVAEIMNRDFTLASRRRAARHFKVSPKVIAHQVRNQLTPA